MSCPGKVAIQDSYAGDEKVLEGAHARGEKLFPWRRTNGDETGTTPE